jgi:hypothetical protein
MLPYLPDYIHFGAFRVNFPQWLEEERTLLSTEYGRVSHAGMFTRSTAITLLITPHACARDRDQHLFQRPNSIDPTCQAE